MEGNDSLLWISTHKEKKKTHPQPGYHDLVEMGGSPFQKFYSALKYNLLELDHLR